MKSIFVGALSAALLPVSALAQTAQTGTQAQTSTQAAGSTDQCIQDLNRFASRMNEDQFWVSGWGTSWGYGTGQATTGVATRPSQAAEPGMAATGTTGDPVTTGTAGVDPWAASGIAATGVQSPRQQIEVLFGAAHVLARQGDAEGCEYLLSRLSQTYDNYVSRLQEAGVDPNEVTDWRRERLVMARPVSEVKGTTRLTVDDVTGTDVRNLEDENLGSVSDVVLDPQTGQISYAIVARGGFLGIGEDQIAVPWERFSITPGLNALVLDVPEATFADAPQVDPDRFGDVTGATGQDQQVDSYWQQTR